MTIGNQDIPTSRTNLAWYLVLFFGQFAIGSFLVFWLELREKSSDSPLATAAGIGSGLEWVVVVAGALSFAIVEGVNMLAAKYREQLWARGMEKGREVGRAEGRKESSAEWEAWAKRFKEALARGEEFDEPMPSEVERQQKS